MKTMMDIQSKGYTLSNMLMEFLKISVLATPIPEYNSETHTYLSENINAEMQKHTRE